MPTIDQIQAKVSHYQNNGALNALVHVLVPQIVAGTYGDDAADPHAALKQSVCTAFNAEWGTYLSWEQLQEKLRQVTDPVAREQLLGPVLRRMLAKSFSTKKDGQFILPAPDSVVKLANKFQIAVVEHFEHLGKEQTRIWAQTAEFRPLVPSRQTCGVLRLINTEEGLRFYTPDPQTHNAAYTDLPTLDYDRTAPVLREKLKQSIREQFVVPEHPDEARENTAAACNAITQANFAAVFESQKQEAKETEAKNPGFNLDGLMKGLTGGIKDFFSTDKANPFSPLSGIMKIFEAMMGSFMPMIAGMQKKMEEMTRKPGDALRPEETTSDLAYRLGASDFAEYVGSMSQAGEDGAVKAQHLNARWRAQFNVQGELKSNANTPELWGDVVEGLEKYVGFDEAAECLDKQEQKLLGKLAALIAEVSGTDDDWDSSRGKLVQLFKKYQERKKAADELIKNSDTEETEKRKSLKQKLNDFKEVSACVQKIETKHASLIAQKKLTARLRADQAVVQGAQVAEDHPMHDNLVARLTAAQAALANADEIEGRLRTQETDLITYLFPTPVEQPQAEQPAGMGQRLYNAIPAMPRPWTWFNSRK